ncbi:MAG: LapA family protein [Chitinispirillaceae bacterium]|nr:LapA family protein [Chitinispirillaceae bacterium]
MNMRTLTWLLLFAIALFIALVMVLTFMQPAFKQEVGARIFSVQTRALPVYLYVLGAFLAGLFFGIFSVLPAAIRSRMEGARKSRRIKELEQKLVESETSREESSADAKFLPPESEG